MTPERRHLVYAYLLHRGLTLNSSHARQAGVAWYGFAPEDFTPTATGDKEFAGEAYSRLWYDGIRSVPSADFALVSCAGIAELFDLEGVAGFYQSGGLWRLNIDPMRAALLKPYRTTDGLIAGLLVFKHLNDKEPKLLTSRGLPRGTKAEPYYPERMAS
jgi:hypothetical protein